MPRSAKPRPPQARSDGVMDNGNISAPGGQPNGNAPRSAVPQILAAAGAGGQMPYGEASSLAQSASQMPPPPPGISPEAHAAHLALANYHHGVTPLFAPTQNPGEPVTAGAPLDSSPTNPMAMPPQADITSVNISQILSQAAASTGSSQLANLAHQVAPPAEAAPNPFASLG